MIYLVSREKSLFESTQYEECSPEKAIELLSKEHMLGADTETTGLNPVTKKILTIQLGTPEFQVVWDCTSYPLTMLKELLENPNILFIWANYAFDSMFLLKEGIIQTNFFDLMIGERVLNNGKTRGSYSVSLKTMAMKYCNYDMDKTARGEIITKGLTERTIVYSATDVKYEIPIYEAQQKELTKYHVRKAAAFESKFTIVVGYIKLCGVKLDVNKWKEKMKKDKAKMNKYKEILDNWVVNFYENHQGSKGFIKYKVLVDTKFIHRNDPNIPDDLKFIDIEKIFSGIKTEDGEFEEVKSDKYGFLIYATYKIPFGFSSKATKFTPYVKYVNAVEQDLFNPTQATFGNVCQLNWSSSAQLIPFFEMLGFNVMTIDRKTKVPKKSVDKKIIGAQESVCPELVKAYVGYKEAAKICESFGENFLKKITPEDGRIHADFHSIGADTFRMSCGGGDKGSINLQQLPADAETRACFVSEKGYRWVSIDYKSQESRLIASVTKDPAMIHIYDDGQCQDMHSLVAYMAYPNIIPRDEPLENIKKDYHAIRQDAKGIEFAINYAGDANTIANNKGIPLEEAQEIYNNYMKGFPGMAAYQKYCKEDVMKRGYIQMNNVTGAKAFAEDWDKLSRIQKEMEDHNFWKTFREDPALMEDYKYYKKRKADLGKKSVNYRIQNRGACCFKLTCMLFFNWVKKYNLLGKVKFCIPCHDELNIEAPEDIAINVAKVLLKCFEKGAKPFCTELPLPGDLALDKDGNLPTYWIH